MELNGLPVEEVNISEIRPHPRNYREHPEDQIDHIVESIREHGLYRNIVVARDGTILAGHGVAQAARRMGLERVPVVRLDVDPGSPAALKVLVGDNEIPNLGMKDDRALSEMLREIKFSEGEDLLGTGFDEMMLANLVFVTRPASEIADLDEAAEWAGMPEYEFGGSTLKVVVQFRSEGDRAEFVEMLGVKKAYKRLQTWSIWWPEKQAEDVSALRFEG